VESATATGRERRVRRNLTILIILPIIVKLVSGSLGRAK
jgi:hypothetical protein